MSKKNGYCLAYRKAWTHDAFADLLEAAIWNYLYQNAFYEDGERNFNGTIIKLKRGQIAITPRFLAKGFRITESNARRVIEKLIRLKSVEKQTTTKATIITICNYDKFQASRKTNDEQTANRPRTDRANNNKVNKGSNELSNNKRVSEATRLPFESLPEEWLSFCQEEMKWNIEQSQSAWIAFYDYSNSKDCKTPKRKDWFMVFKNSCRSGYTKPNINLNKGNQNDKDSRTKQSIMQALAYCD